MMSPDVRAGTLPPTVTCIVPSFASFANNGDSIERIGISIQEAAKMLGISKPHF